jgi:archaellum component FlaF (FlaF/FlaG flagellin family)
MIGIAVIVVLIILYILYTGKENKFKEIERQQAMRRAMHKLNEKNSRFSL